MSAAESAHAARQALQALEVAPEFTKDGLETPLRAMVEGMGLSAGQVFGILRVAVTGQKVSPPLFESMEIIGRSVVLERVQQAIGILDGIAGQK